jgi:hypothetical protein
MPPDGAVITYDKRHRFRMAGEHSSSDFASILANTASKALRSAYGEAPRTFTPWTQRMDLPDFKSFTSLNLSSMGPLVPVSEGGGIQYGGLNDSGQAWTIGRYNTGVAITYVAMVNDDLSAFSRIPALAAQAAARLESDLVYRVLLANGTMTETTGALFNATATTTAGGHANLHSGATSDLTPDADGITALAALVVQLGCGSFIVRYGALDVARARGRETLTDDPTLGDGPVEFDVVDAIGRAEENARLRGCLEKLDERTRHSIALAFVRGMSHAEVAHEMNMPLGTVKSIIRRGLLNLRGCLSRPRSPCPPIPRRARRWPANTCSARSMRVPRPPCAPHWPPTRRCARPSPTGRSISPRSPPRCPRPR